MWAEVVTHVGDDIECNSVHWDDKDVLKWRSLVHLHGNGKITRSDQHGKQLVVDTAIQNKRFKTPMEHAG